MRMSKRKSTKNLIIVIIAALLAVIAAGFMLIYMTGEREVSTESSAENTQVDSDEAQPLATLFFASDYQEQSFENSPADNLRGILYAAKDAGKTVETVIICGDYTNDEKLHDYQLSPDASINEIKNVIKDVCPQVKENDEIFVQGNHDRMSDLISESGLHEFDDFLVYVVNTQENFPWKQGVTRHAKEKIKKTSLDMKQCFDKLIADNEKRPVIIAGHVPLHFSGRTSSLHTTGDNMYSSLLFNEVNEAGKKLDIIYLFGHNHTKGWDCYMGGSCVYRQAGDEILIPDCRAGDRTTDRYSAERLNFTYMNAGYIGHYMNCSPDEVAAGTVDKYAVSDCALTGTVCEIYGDKIVLTRYSKDGEHPLGGEGCHNPYRDDSSIIDAEHYGHGTDGSVSIERGLLR